MPLHYSCPQYLYVKRGDVLDRFASDFVLVVINPQKVEQVFFVISETGPKDKDLGFLNGGRPFIFQVVDMNHLLSKLILDIILKLNTVYVIVKQIVDKNLGQCPTFEGKGAD